MNSNEPFRRTINDFISEKRAIGYEYDKNEQILMRVANLHEKMGYTESVLPKELVVKWTEKTPYETEVNRLHRISTLRGLAEYMQRIGLPAYSIPRKSIPYREGTYVPYIYTDDELARIFTAADSIIPTAEIPFRQIQFSLLVRMLYGTGARISELLNLEKQDFNLQQGTILIRHAKLDKERIIPISESLRVRTVSYMKEMTQYGVWNNTCYLIPNSVGNCYSPNSIYHYFRRILWDAGISHGGRGKGPRVHDFRHTYAVHCLRNWTREDKDLTVALPYLSAYMGHAGARSTQYYLRLTAELYPDIISRLDDAYGWMIPEVPYERNL
jgi:integrase/recombinase XerD